jgi:hypothetical protein
MADAKGAGQGKKRQPGKAPAGRTDAEDVDGLFQLPLAEFTAARNALASQLKKAGETDRAAEVKSLVKPSISAWVVNQLYWQHRASFERLMETGERFRNAQTAQLSGKSADLRGALEERRVALGELARLAADLLRGAGSTPTPEAMRRITTTLEALSTYGSLPEAPRAGRLSDDVDPPGFEVLAALVPGMGRGDRSSGPSRVIPFQHQPRRRAGGRKSGSEEAKQAEEEARKARVAAARSAMQEAERAVREARKDAQQAEALLKGAAARAKEAEKEKIALEQRFETAAAGYEAARQEARRVAAEAEEAAQALQDAEQALEKARRELSTLE